MTVRLEPGMRVRCVDPIEPLEMGAEYVVDAIRGGPNYPMIRPVGFHPAYAFFADRFKPIVRVKARCVPSIGLLLRRAVAAVEAMTPTERAEMQRKQAESWARSCVGDDFGTRVLP